MSIFKDVHTIVDGAWKNAENFHEEAPSGYFEEESVADSAYLTSFVQKRFGHQVISVNGECTVVRN